jgi:O-antigen/teichoic acid export membrane protein
MALYFRLDVMILARLKPADDVGQYGAGYRFLEAFMVLPTMIMSVLAPVLARSFVEGAGVLQRRYGLAMHLVSVIAIGVSVAGAMIAWRVLPALPGFGEYDGGGVALSILSPAAGLILVGTIVQGALIAGHRQQRLLRISAYGLAANLVLNVALIPSYSYVGAAIATTATEVLLVALSIREVRLRLSLRWPVTRMWPVLAAAAVMAAAIAVTYAVNPFLQVGIAAAAFLAVLTATGGLRPADLQPFRQVRA